MRRAKRPVLTAHASERAIIASIFADPAIFPEVRQALKAEDFDEHRHREAIAMMTDITDAGTELSYINVYYEASRRGMHPDDWLYLSSLGNDLRINLAQDWRSAVKHVAHAAAQRGLLRVVDVVDHNIGIDAAPGETIAWARSQLEKQEAHATSPDGENALNTSRVADWPDPMGKAAYIGPIGSYVKKLAPQTEAAPEALLMQALAAAGNAMGRHAHYAIEADLHHTNLNVVIVGGTGARKGVSWGHVRRFVKRADDTWEADHIINGLSTGEGLINAVRDAEEGMQSPIPDKVALAFESEFAAVFKVKGREGNTLSTVLRQAWDGDMLRTLTKNSPLKATGAHISIVGHITPEELRRLMTETDATNGFANRMLWVCVKRARYLPDGGDEVNLNDEVTALCKAIAYGRKVGRLRRDDEAKALWAKRYRDLSSGRPGLFGSVTNRAEAQVTRLALIYALLDQSPVITKRHLQAALAVWDYCLASARFLFSAALGDALAEKLDKELAAHGAKGMSRTEIYNSLGNNHSADDIAHALGVLAGQSRAEKRREKGDGGRAVDRWYSLTHNVNNVNNENSDGEDTEDGDAPKNTLNTFFTSYVPDAEESADDTDVVHHNGHKPGAIADVVTDRCEHPAHAQYRLPRRGLVCGQCNESLPDELKGA